MNKHILSTDVQHFLHENATTDATKVALKKSPFDGVSSSQLAEQVDSRQRLKSKLPHWLQADNIYYPPKQNAEQCSSEATALYKASLVQGHRAADLTGGFGVDVWALSQCFDEVHYGEMNADLFPISKHNFAQLGCRNVICHLGNSLEWLVGAADFDLIYLDPARRDEHNRKMVSFADCLPNVLENQDFLFSKSPRVMLKASPMMDISLALSELKCVKEVHIVALKNECKELLFILEKAYSGEPKIISVDIKGDSNVSYSFTKTEEQDSRISLSMPQAYLYEPNSATLKAGAFSSLSERFALHKLHAFTHLYTSHQLIADFPGQCYIIKHSTEYKKKSVLAVLDTKKANVKSYNFANTPDQIKKKLGVKDGGHTYLFGAKTMDEKYRMLICEKAVSHSL